MNPVGASLILLLMVVVVVAPRRWAVMGFMGGVFYLTQGQAISLGGFNMFPTRFIEVAAAYRVWQRREFTLSEINNVDKVLVALCVYTVIVYGLRTRDGFFYQLGSGADALLCYFAFRGLIQDFADYDWFLKALAVALVPFLAILWFERLTGRNLFEFMGGLSVGYYNRDGHPRCMGSFRHPSLMGSVGATYLASYIAMFLKRDYRPAAGLGIFVCFGMIVASNSGGPFNTAGIVIVGWLLWGMRTRMRLFRWGLSATFILLAMVMKAPIYYLPAKVGSITGGGGYHRSYLIEMALKDFGKWSIAGIDLTETADWFPYTLDATGGADMTNYFLSYGVRGGIGAVMILIYLLVVCFKLQGGALAHVRTILGNRKSELVLWGLGVLLAAHISNWFSISYWDQFSVIFYLQLATLVSLCIAALRESKQPEQGELVGDAEIGAVSI
jgi:hypothetical protein